MSNYTAKYQLKSNDIVFVKGIRMTVKEAGQHVAMSVFGLHGWQGMQAEVVAPAGLGRAANAYLRTLGNRQGVVEIDRDGSTSVYSPTWQ